MDPFKVPLPIDPRSSVPLGQSAEYQSFRSSVPLRKIAIDSEEPDKTWSLFDCGPRSITCPLVCLPPVSGTADVFFLQCLALSARGVRVIAVDAPAYWSVDEWCRGFKQLLTQLSLEKVHIFGAALGGFLAQKFAEFTRPCPRVASLILCNSFTDTTVFKYTEQSQMFWLLPSPVLKGMVIGGIETQSRDNCISKASNFMADSLNSLDQSVLASRLQINCQPSYVQPHLVNDLPVTIITVFDESALSEEVKDELYKSYPTAKLAHLKTGGNFPYLSRSEEVNLHIMIHLRNFDQAIA